MKHTYSTFAAALFLSAVAFAQPPGPAGVGGGGGVGSGAGGGIGIAGQPPGREGWRTGPPMMMRGEEPMAALRGPQGRWWGNPELAQKLALTADQIKKMDDILQQHRLQLVDLHATLEKQELMLEPLVSADQPDENKLLAQIDKVAQARAELEKANARMLLDIRRVLTQDQWQKLKAETPNGPRPAGGRRGGPQGGAPRPAGR